jgi:hypothetical protein
MAELLLKSKKGYCPPPAEVFELPVEPSLLFQTAHETDPYVVDLRLFAKGLTTEEIARREGAGKLAKPFGARPQLIQELLPHIRDDLMYARSQTCSTYVDGLKWWWRFLDACHEIAPVDGVADFDPIHYATYRIKPCGETRATPFFRVVAAARAARGLPDLYWTAIRLDPAPTDLLAHEDVARLYTYFQQRCKVILMCWEADESVMPKRGDMQALYIMFIILTGWNPAVVLAIDVTETNPDGSLACIMQDVQNPLYSVITSVKHRSDSIQQAHGLNKQRISCINIVKALYRQSAPLRARLQHELAQNVARRDSINRCEITVTKVDANRLVKEIADLKRKLGCPWIYTGRSGKITLLTNTDIAGGGRRSPLNIAAARVNAEMDSARLRGRLPVNAKPVAVGIKLTDLRDAFISFRWRKGGYSWLATMMAAGHKSLASLNAYLNKRQHYQESQQGFLSVTTETWNAINDLPSGAARVMPMVIAARANGIPEDKVIRWLQGQDITIQGVGCRDHKNPPRLIAPNHKPESGCKSQRCLLCPSHAVLLPDSYVYIAKRLAELRDIQATMSVMAWVESDYPEEVHNVEWALTLYDLAEVTKELVFWEKEIQAGRHISMRMEGVSG